ncbi:hypothetical protein Tco_0956070 [Tanacetum coccineum]|uniref:Uncharacterized protein n=1 Tax=Tanacetum coccineum TaxID=301880 RepID=A0ABQ5E8Y4_9ASTR
MIILYPSKKYGGDIYGPGYDLLTTLDISSPKHQSDTQVITVKMEILLEPTSNKLMVERFDTLAGNPAKEIVLKLNLPDHKLILTDLKIEVKESIALKLITRAAGSSVAGTGGVDGTPTSASLALSSPLGSSSVFDLSNL